MTEYIIVGTPEGKIGCALIQAMFGGTVPGAKLAMLDRGHATLQDHG